MSVVRALLDNIKQEGKIHNISPDASVLEALQLMAKEQIGALLVMEDGDCIGIFTERDYARKGELQERAAKSTNIREVMTGEPLHTVSPLTTLEECLAVMDSHHVRHLPVKDGAKVVGIISIRDVVHGVVDYQIFLMQQFQNYIGGTS